jgi:hypothetical protein
MWTTTEPSSVPDDLILVVHVQRRRLARLHLNLDDRQLARRAGRRTSGDDASQYLLQRCDRSAHRRPPRLDILILSLQTRRMLRRSGDSFLDVRISELARSRAGYMPIA